MSIRSVLAASSLVVLATTSAHAAVLYDGSLGTTPQQQGLTYIATPGATNTTAAGGTTLDTTVNVGTYAGYGTNAVPLNRATGYTFRVDAKVNSESHPGNNDRAGFSLLVVSSDLRAIEIGFHADEVFSQNSVVTTASRGETAAFTTTGSVREYDLVVLGNTYTLKANGTSILTGALRDYTNFGGPPYTVPNSVFLGDDTTSAGGSTLFTYVSVPEPMSVGAIAGVAMIAMRRRRAVIS